MSAVDNNQEHVEKLASLIQGIRVAMLTTAAPDGSLHSRPMANQQKEFDGTLWFFTQAHAVKVDEVSRSEQVNVSYADADAQHYVSVSGRARVIRDRATMAERWHPILKAWFPKGLDDPDLALLRVEAEKAEYWDGPSSTLVHMVGFIKALTTGQPYRPGENEKVDLSKGEGSA